MLPRVLRPFLAEIARLDVTSTRSTDPPDDANVLASGYDDDFQDVLVFEQGGARTSARKESTVYVPCQVEQPMDKLRQRASGNDPEATIAIVVTRRDLLALDLIDPVTGESRIRVNDRLVAIKTPCGDVALAMRTPVFCVEVEASFGLGTLPDLFVLSFRDRDEAAPMP